MKVCHSVIRYFPAIGGVEEYVRYLSKELLSLGHEVSVVTTNSAHHQKYQRLDVPLRQKSEDISIRRNRVFPFVFRKYLLSPGLLLDLLRQKTEVIHAHSYMYCSADFALIASLIRNKPLVFTPYLSGLNNPSLVGKSYRKLFGKFLFKADCVLVISPFERNLVLSWGFNTKKIEEVSPGVDLDEFKSSDEGDIYNKMGIKHENKILYVGRIDYMKGLDVLVNSAERVLDAFKDTCFIIAGPDFGYKKQLENLIKNKGLEQNFKFIGPFSRKEIISLYKGCTMFVFPSRYEAFGMAAAEAMAAKKPVVATNTSAIPNVVMNEKTGLLFDYENADSLSSKILILLRDEKLRQEMGERGYLRVKENFNWKKSAKKLEKIYKEVVKNS